MTGQWYIFEKKDKLGNSFDSLYPSRLLGFISINGEHEAVVQCSLSGSLQKHFVVCLWQSNNLFLETYLQMN